MKKCAKPNITKHTTSRVRDSTPTNWDPSSKCVRLLNAIGKSGNPNPPQVNQLYQYCTVSILLSRIILQSFPT